MGYTWTNSSWQRMEGMKKQEMLFSKLIRVIPNFHNGDGYGGNAYGRNNHGDGNSISRRQMGVGNFTSHNKTFEYIPYDDYGDYNGVNASYDYCENSLYDCYKGYHDGLDCEFSPTCLHHNINKRKETYHGVRRPRRVCWMKTILMLWKFVNDVPCIALFNASTSNVAHLLWLFEGMDSRMNLFKERGYDMTQDENENVEIF
ncbi:hypothetical protein M9H77_07827 [Catharanthus roseus]|uniref:Uncharacterized protein n=1 Tax=Catharanthus roseus TaxID=4058 RepID=A0ACC0BWA4_CATRO|nr:hypothetical protein M9H77_07827 [Catharanthus roseus]